MQYRSDGAHHTWTPFLMSRVINSNDSDVDDDEDGNCDSINDDDDDNACNCDDNDDNDA